MIAHLNDRWTEKKNADASDRRTAPYYGGRDRGDSAELLTRSRLRRTTARIRARTCVGRFENQYSNIITPIVNKLRRVLRSIDFTTTCLFIFLNSCLVYWWKLANLFETLGKAWTVPTSSGHETCELYKWQKAKLKSIVGTILLSRTANMSTMRTLC